MPVVAIKTGVSKSSFDGVYNDCCFSMPQKSGTQDMHVDIVPKSGRLLGNLTATARSFGLQLYDIPFEKLFLRTWPGLPRSIQVVSFLNES